MATIATTYSKSNEMVSAKYRSSLLENKIMAIALTRIEDGADDSLEAKLYPRELIRVISDKKHIYDDLKKISKRIVSHAIFLEDGKGNFKSFAMVTNADYINGEFTIRFNRELKNHILNLESHFTKLNLTVMTSFENVNAFRLYELFKSEFYKADKNGNLDLEYNLSELKFIIGVANSDNEAHKNRLAEMKNKIDWDYLYECLDKKDKKYEGYSQFRTRVLNVAKQELDNKGDISFSYEEGLKKGKKVLSVIFHVYKNTPQNPDAYNAMEEYIKEKNVEDRQYVMPRDLPEYADIYEKYIGHNDLTAEDIDLLILKANMDGDLVVKAIYAADNQEYLRNYMGWIIKYIEAGGYEDVATINGDHERAVVVENFQKDYEQHIDETATRVWNKAKTKPDIEQFIKALNIKSIEDFELIYDDPSEAYQMYIDWKKANKPE